MLIPTQCSSNLFQSCKLAGEQFSELNRAIKSVLKPNWHWRIMFKKHMEPSVFSANSKLKRSQKSRVRGGSSSIVRWRIILLNRHVDKALKNEETWEQNFNLMPDFSIRRIITTFVTSLRIVFTELYFIIKYGIMQ